MNITDRPFQVEILRSGFKNSLFRLCGGSIISESYVLTAAHCIEDMDKKDLFIRSGSSYWNKGGQLHNVTHMDAHKYYKVLKNNGIPYNDIAVIKVEPHFKIDKTTQSVPLIPKEQLSKVDSIAIVSGWGSTENFDHPEQLLAVKVPIVSTELCNEAYSGDLPYGQICAGYYGEGGKDHCYGDSGGPLTIDGVLVGIVSWSEGCAEPEYPGVYTGVAYNRDWIKNQTGL